MTPVRLPLTRYYWAIAVSLITLLTGGWLILAPFALGYQPYGASWTDATKNDFWFGIGIVVVSLVSLGLFVRSLMASLHTAGIVQARPRPRPAPAPAPTPVAAAPAPAAVSPDLERTIASLAAALAADLQERRKEEPQTPTQPLQTTRRDS